MPTQTSLALQKANFFRLLRVVSLRADLRQAWLSKKTLFSGTKTYILSHASCQICLASALQE
jgi:hypothetical protein